MARDLYETLPPSDEKYHILELGAGDYSKSLSMGGAIAHALDSLGSYGRFDYTATELEDNSQRRMALQMHLVQQGNISSSRSHNSLDSVMLFRGGVDATRLEREQPETKSDLILWQAPHTGVHGNSLSFADPRQRLVQDGERFFEKHKSDLPYPQTSLRGDLEDLQKEIKSNIGLMVGFFESAHHKISHQMDENGKRSSGKIALVVLNSIPFRSGRTYMPSIVAEEYGWNLVKAGHIEDYSLERTSTREKVNSKTGATLFIYEESQEYLNQLSPNNFTQMNSEKAQLENIIIDAISHKFSIGNMISINQLPPQPTSSVSSTASTWNQSVTPSKWALPPPPSTVVTEEKEPLGSVTKPDHAMDLEDAEEEKEKNNQQFGQKRFGHH